MERTDRVPCAGSADCQNGTSDPAETEPADQQRADNRAQDVAPRIANAADKSLKFAKMGKIHSAKVSLLIRRRRVGLRAGNARDAAHHIEIPHTRWGNPLKPGTDFSVDGR
jgi:hypothetical protein